MLQGDEVVRALLAAVATLEDLVEVGRDSQMALSTLEEIAFELGKMDSEEESAVHRGPGTCCRFGAEPCRLDPGRSECAGH